MMNHTNRRATGMWSIIQPRLAKLSGHIATRQGSLTGLDIVDLGSGFGDLATRAAIDGADYVACVDKNNDNLKIVDAKMRRIGIPQSSYACWRGDLSSSADHKLIFQRSFDVGICTSVLPYIDKPDELLQKMANFCAISIIECQYDGDGPGFGYIMDDTDMERWLSRHWRSVQRLGKTDLDIRDASRTIWACVVPIWV